MAEGLTPKERDEIEEDYGLSYALFRAYPELHGLLDKAIDGTWTPQKFQVELRQTNWFKKHSDVWRKNIALKYADPATYKERLANQQTALRNIAASLGIRLSKKTLGSLTRTSFNFGWDEGQMRDHLARYIKPSATGDYGGELAQHENNLSSLAYQNGVRISRNQMRGWMRSIARGDGSPEQFQNYIRKIAASTFSLYGDQIKAGANLLDVANPYIQAMAGTLELNPGEIDLFDPTVRKALSGVKDDKGVAQPLSITDFEDQLRRDKRWQYTKTAQTQAKGYATAIARMWGLQ